MLERRKQLQTKFKINQNLKMKIIINFIFVISVMQSVYSQTCDCTKIFKDIVEATESNYSLFQFKVNDKKGNTKSYNNLKSLLREEVKNVSQKECNQLIETYITFFYDEHLWADIFIEKKETKYKEHIKIDTSKVYAQLQKTENPLLGIWESSTYKVAIIPNKNNKRERDFVAVILESKNPSFTQGDVKIEFKKANDYYETNFVMGDFSVYKETTTVFPNSHLEIGELNSWRKLYPLPKKQQPIAFHAIDKSAIYFKDLGNKNYYIKIGSFQSQNRKKVGQIVSDNRDKLREANNLIVDIRGNSGGSDSTYFPLLPYIYSGEVELLPMAIWTSEYNKENYFKDWLSAEDSLKKTPFYNVMQEKESKLFYWKDENYTHKLDTIFSNPKHVGIIMDEESASSAETFVLRSQQSNRVTTFGQNTSGTVDGFNGNSIVTDCYRLRYPTSIISINYPDDAIDPHGIYPDVFLSKNQENTVAFIIKYLNQLD